MDLDDILTDKKEQTNEEPKIQEKDPVERTIREALREKELDARAEGEGKQRDPVTGKFVPKEEKKEEAKAEEKKEEPKPEPKAEPKEQQDFSPKERALLLEADRQRRRAQELEQRLAALEQQNKEPPKPFFEDPDGVLKQREEQLTHSFMQQRIQDRVQFFDELGRIKYQDYDQAVEVFKEIAANAPGLFQQCMAAPNPAEFAYKVGKHHKEMREVGSIEEYKKKAEKEIRARVEAELKEKYEKEMKARQDLVPSLSDARSTQSNKAVWGGPTPLDNILGS